MVCVVRSVELNIRQAGGFCTCCCGGEGMFNTVMTGPGQVYVQSMSYAKFKKALMVAAQGAAAGANAGAGAAGAPPEAEEMAR